jgi:hypothetical protein
MSDVQWLSRDLMRAVLRKEGVPCKTSKAELQAQVSAVLAARKSGEALDEAGDDAAEEERRDKEGGGEAPAKRSRDRSAKRGEKPRAKVVAPNSLAGVELLIGEAGELRICGPELQRLVELAERAQRWRLAARHALDTQGEVSEAQLDELLAELSALPLRLHERALLRRDLLRKRWLLSARLQLGAALHGVPTLTYLHAMTNEAAELGLGDVDEVRPRIALAPADPRPDKHARSCSPVPPGRFAC